MASAQVLHTSSISSKKQQQLEAGKKRLEEFRKKKAAAKKAASNNSIHSANGDLNEKKPLVTESVQLKDGTFDAGAGSILEENENKRIDIVREADLSSTYVTRPIPTISSYNTYAADPGPTHSADEKLRDHDAHAPYGSVGDSHALQEGWNNANFKSSAGYGIDIEQSRVFHPPKEDIDITSNHVTNIRFEGAISNSSDQPSNDLTFSSPVRTQFSVTNGPGHSNQLSNGPIYEDSSSKIRKSVDGVFQHENLPDLAIGDRRDSSPSNHQASESSSSLWSPESKSTSDAVPSTNQGFMPPSVTGRRSRPSFLDSITSKSSSASLSHAEAEKTKPPSPKAHPVDALVSYASQSFRNASIANGGQLFRHAGNELDMERSNNYYSEKQNEDFASLEQHIEDLTQEKFSLQRALEASRVLAESLASENSALTDSYNQQGDALHQLRSEMERLQEEIKAQLVELEAMRIEYGNAQLECNAADERAKLLASEVIGLEEKSLRLRSNELKLERELENLQAEMSSYKRRTSSLEKESQDLQVTIDALQEEKKMLLSKLRKAPASGKLVDINKSQTTKKEAATSTEDLVNDDEDATTLATSNHEMPSVDNGSDACSSSLQPQNMQFGLEVPSLSIPSDQMRMIQNINTLISELTLDKQELMQSLSGESSQCSKLKDLNKELSQKLEIQTQRLELLTAQRMVNDTIRPDIKSDSRIMVDNTPYADEGDEVVERVLGWIMKLFPGGPSRRQTKHL